MLRFVPSYQDIPCTVRKVLMTMTSGRLDSLSPAIMMSPTASLNFAAYLKRDRQIQPLLNPKLAATATTLLLLLLLLPLLMLLLSLLIAGVCYVVSFCVL